MAAVTCFIPEESGKNSSFHSDMSTITEKCLFLVNDFPSWWPKQSKHVVMSFRIFLQPRQCGAVNYWYLGSRKLYQGMILHVWKLCGRGSPPAKERHQTGNSVVLKSKDSGSRASSSESLIRKVFPFGAVVWQFNVCVGECVCVWLSDRGVERGRTEVPGGAIRLLWEELNFQSPHYNRWTFHGSRPSEDKKSRSVWERDTNREWETERDRVVIHRKSYDLMPPVNNLNK